ncbi:putative ER organization and biogenesis-related protein [Gigaspora margarita]|uniref:Putative ER organization and biogenesis-related protein n=1 Tax=Gigaspora margarita TaxID=4874 RepID=A0A8H3XGU7_GIGMA|nr:putative ER organization and biogenesis-related protein [Gigaspora margarita]
MEDLDDLIWGSNSTKPQTQKNNNLPLNAMRGGSTTIPTTIPTTQSTSTPLKNKPSANSPVYLSPASNNITQTNSTLNRSLNRSPLSRSPLNSSPVESPKLSPAKNTPEAFDNLISFNKKSTTLTLHEQLKLQEQEKRRKAQEDHQRITEHYDQSKFWDSLERKGSGSSSPLPQPSGDLFDDILTTSSSEFGSFETAQNNPLKNKSILTQSNPSGNSIDKWNTNFSSNNTTTFKDVNTSSSTTDDLLDFDIFNKPPKSTSPAVTTNVDDDKIVPSIINKKIISKSSFQDLNSSQSSCDDSKDHLIAQIVEMGFSASEAEAALAATDNRDDVQSAIEILFQQREAEDQLRKKQLTSGRRKINNNNNTLNSSNQDNDGDYEDDSEPGFTSRGRYPSKINSFSVPKRNIYGRNASDGESSDLSSSSTSSNFYQSKEKFISTASEFGLSALKKASALYKQSKDKVNKAIEDFQLQLDSEEESTRKPRWLRENDFQESDDYSSEKFSDSHDKFIGKPNDKHGGLQKIPSSCDNTSSENLGINKFVNRYGDKYGRLEKFHDSYDDSSSDDDQQIIDRNNFASIPSDFNDLIDSKKSKSPKPVVPSRSTKPNIDLKPTVPSRSTKPNIDFGNSSYVSPARRRPHINSSSTLVDKPTPVHKSPPKITQVPRPIVHVSPEQLRNSELNKIKGNEVFKLGQFGDAENFYSLAIDCLPSKHIQLVILYNNRATTKFKNGNQRGCVDDCTLALKLIDDYTLPPPPGVNIDLKAQYIKALLRRASAYESMEKYNIAKDDYQKIMNIDPNGNKQVSDGLRRCQQAINMSSNDVKPMQKSSNSSGFDDDFVPSSTQSYSTLSNPFVSQLNEFGFINPTTTKQSSSNPIIETTVDPNNPAVVKLRNQTRQQEFEDAEKLRCKDQVDQKLMQWKGGKETNIRALISSLDTVLWEGLGWKSIGLHELVTPAQVKIKYMKAIGKVHPDKLSNFTTIEQGLLANGVFSSLNDAWDVFKTQNNI